MDATLDIVRAYAFAADRHVGQRRKGADAEPYVNHLTEVARLVAEATGGADVPLIIAAILHDVLEDTDTAAEEVEQVFGADVLGLVREVSDDKTLPKAERKRLQVVTAPGKSRRAKILKLADKISNLISLVERPPADWSVQRRRDYVRWAQAVGAGLRGVNADLEAQFDAALAAAEAAYALSPDPAPVVLALMCKAPMAGASKTRLCPPLSATAAATLSGAFIADTASTLASVSASTGASAVVVYTPADGKASLAGLLPAGVAMIGQRGEDLSERLLNAARDLLTPAVAGVCFINADSPTLPPALVVRAVDALRRPGDRVVLGPSIDGGYYLIGIKRPHAGVFENVSWSSSQVLAQTLKRTVALRLPVEMLPLWYDVDDAASLDLLLEELFGAGNPLAAACGAGGAAARSRALLAEWRNGAHAAAALSSGSAGGWSGTPL